MSVLSKQLLAGSACRRKHGMMRVHGTCATLFGSSCKYGGRKMTNASIHPFIHAYIDFSYKKKYINKLIVFLYFHELSFIQDIFYISISCIYSLVCLCISVYVYFYISTYILSRPTRLFFQLRLLVCVYVCLFGYFVSLPIF